MSLVGRERERATIDEILANGRRARGDAVVFRGEPGIGKSTLLRHAVALAPDFLVLETCGTAEEQHIAFAALEHLLRPVLDGLTALPLVQADALRGAFALGPSSPATDPFAVCAATLSLLTQAAEHRPLLVVVDDLQWLDAASKECLLFSARRLGADTIAMVFAERCLSPTHSILGSAPTIRTADVPGLTYAEAEKLVAGADIDGIRPEALNRLVTTTAGNPLALLELAAGTTREGDPVGENVVVGELFAPYVASLDHTARRLLLLAAVSGSDDVGTVVPTARALRLPVESLNVLVDRGLLVSSPLGLRFRHQLVRSAVIGSATTAELRAAHRALADALADPEDADRRAWHLAEAAMGPDEEVAAELESAAERARSRLAYSSCASALERAAALSESRQRRAGRMLAAARAARLAGDLTAARRTARIASELSSDPMTCGHAEAIVGWMSLSIGSPDEAGAHLRRAGALFEGADAAMAAEAHAGAAIAARLAGDMSGAAMLASRARDLCDPRTDGSAVLAYVTLGIVGLTGGDVHDPVEQLQEAFRRLARSRPAPDEMVVAAYAARSAWPFDLSAIRTVVADVAAELRASGALGSLPCALYALSYLDLRMGDLRRAHDRAEEAAALAATTGDLLIQRLAMSCLALVAAHRGDEQACRSAAAGAIALLPPHGSVIAGEVFDALGLLELQLGNHGQAEQHLDRDNRAGPSDELDLSRWSISDLAEVYFRSGRPLPIRLAGYVEAMSGVSVPGVACVMWRTRGLYAEAGSYAECFERALGFHRETPMPIEEARTRLCYGERLRRDGLKREARDQLKAALAMFDHAGARLFADRARGELAATGEHVPRHWSGGTTLTAQECRVAELVARGLSNRDAAAALFVSPKTVEAHLGSVYRKLGVRSRTQLAHQLARAGQPSAS